MNRSSFQVWGESRGAVLRLSPFARVLSGATLFISCMVFDVTRIPGLAAALLAVFLWIWTCRPPSSLVRSLFFFGVVMFVPYLFLVPYLYFSSSPQAGSWSLAARAPLSLFLKGMFGLLISVTTASSVSVSDLRQALKQMHVPEFVSMILLQIIQQTSSLLIETRRVSEALALRTASSGIVTAARVLSSLPKVWLPRIINRAERVADVMDLRGFCDTSILEDEAASVSRLDIAALVFSLFYLSIAIFTRCKGL